jgi:hypothetical protein
MDGPALTGLVGAGPALAGLAGAGPALAGLAGAGPALAGPAMAFPVMAGRALAGPAMAGQAPAGPALAGPALTGLAGTGPAMAGPALSGPAMAGPAVREEEVQPSGPGLRRGFDLLLLHRRRWRPDLPPPLKACKVRVCSPQRNYSFLGAALPGVVPGTGLRAEGVPPCHKRQGGVGLISGRLRCRR